MGEDQPLRLLRDGIDVKGEGRSHMDIQAEGNSEIRAEDEEVYEPPMLDEIGEFTALTRASNRGSVVDGTGYYSE
jgi:hypothetical protein